MTVDRWQRLATLSCVGRATLVAVALPENALHRALPLKIGLDRAQAGIAEPRQTPNWARKRGGR